MIAQLNLATHPFERRRRFYVLASGSGVLLLAATLLLVAYFARDFTRVRALSRRTADMGAQAENLSGEQRRLEQALERPEAVDILERSRFLNSLIRQKAVSWTQIFMDLESLMPERVQVVAVRPAVKENTRNALGPVEMDLHMTVSSENIATLVALVRRVEKSDKFHRPLLRLETPPRAGGGDTLYELQMSVFYAQK